jgi:hypothetical protein
MKRPRVDLTLVGRLEAYALRLRVLLMEQYAALSQNAVYERSALDRDIRDITEALEQFRPPVKKVE